MTMTTDNISSMSSKQRGNKLLMTSTPELPLLPQTGMLLKTTSMPDLQTLETILRMQLLMPRAASMTGLMLSSPTLLMQDNKSKMTSKMLLKLKMMPSTHGSMNS
jgi:hypothetical protein